MVNQGKKYPNDKQVIKPNQNLGLTQEYDRDLYEGKYGNERKAKFKDKEFANRETIVDQISGEKLHKSQEAAKNKYGKTQWPKHSSEVDHVTSIEDAHSHLKNNPFITDDDLKEMINSDENFRILSKTMNASKKNQSDFSLIKEGKKKKNNVKGSGNTYYKDNDISLEGKVTIATQKVKSDVYLHKEVTKRTVKNFSKEAGIGSINALYNNLIPLTSRAVDNMCQVAIGDISFGDAAKNFSKDVVDVAVAGGAKQIADDLVKFQIKQCGNSVLKGFVESNEFTKIVQVSLIVKDAAIRYVNGEITGEEFISEVGNNGTKMVVGLIGAEIGKEAGTYIGGLLGTLSLPGVGTIVGAAAGRVIGEILGTIITTVACSAIMAYHQKIKHLTDYKKIESQILKMEKDILVEMKRQREKFESIIKTNFQVWDQKIEKGFQMLLEFSCEETFQFEKVNEGLDLILSAFGTETKYKSTDEFKKTFGEKIILKV